jgi:hypothetical protein
MTSFSFSGFKFRELPLDIRHPKCFNSKSKNKNNNFLHKEKPMPKAPKPQIPIHPLLGNAAPAQPLTPTIQLYGYVGPASQPGQVRLYQSLDDLSHYLEFDEAGVAATDAAPQDIAPNKGLSISLKANTPVRWTREYKSATSLANKIKKMIQGGSSPPGIP